MRGWKAINESDMLIIPDPSTAFIDKFIEAKTLSLICDVYDPLTKEKYERCPRSIAQKAEAYLASTGIADTAFMGAEAEFFIFDDIRFDTNEHSSYYYLDSIEGRWNSGREEMPNLGYKPRYKEGYYPVPPTDHLQDIRNEMTLNMIAAGLDVETQHHEVASGGQAEIDLRFAPLLRHADDMLKYKYIIKNTARLRGKTVTFMPKPVFSDNGSGMHVHQSLWKSGKPLFYGNGYADIDRVKAEQLGVSVEDLFATLEAAYRHKGFAFVRILQRCPVYTPTIYQEAVRTPDLIELLTHADGITVPGLEKTYKRQLVHDPKDIDGARRLAEEDGQWRLGLFFRDESRPRYEDMRYVPKHTAEEKMALLEKELDRYAI